MDTSTPRRRGFRPSPPALLLAVLLLPIAPALAAGRPALSTPRTVSLDLPGAPAAVVAADLDGDGRVDLIVAVATNQWDEVAITESSTMDDVKGLVDVMTIVPAVIDRREVRFYRALPGGTYAPPVSLALPLSVLSLEAGPPGTPVIALTDAGVSVLRFDPPGTLRLEPWIADPPVMAGTGNFLGDLNLMQDVNGDDLPDLILPARDGIAIYLARPEKGLARNAASRLAVPGEAFRSARDLEHRYPLPEVADVTGDGRPRPDLPRSGQTLALGLGVAQRRPGALPAGGRGGPRHRRPEGAGARLDGRSRGGRPRRGGLPPEPGRSQARRHAPGA